MEKTFYILRDNNDFSYVTDLKDEQKTKVVFQKTINEKGIKLFANKKINEFKRQLGLLEEKTIEELPIRFKGTGEVNNFVFHQVYFHNLPDEEQFYIYIVDGNYFEIFDRVVKRNKVIYPTSEDFGNIAWTFANVNNLINFVRYHYGVNLTKEQLNMSNI